MSNPIAHNSADNRSHIFCRGTDGQVYGLDQATVSPISFGSWYLVGSVGHKLPGLPKNGRDSLIVIANRHNQLTLFVRGEENATSFLYWSVSQSEEHGNWTTWNMVGGSDVHLKYDATVMLNNFVRVGHDCMVHCFCIGVGHFLLYTRDVVVHKFCVLWCVYES